MLKRKIIYTAVTRSKVNVALIGDQEYLKNAILHGEEDPRYTLLQQRLRAPRV